MSDELEPCPFCGAGAGIENGPPELWYVECTDCGISGKIRYSKEAAIEVWNRRSPAAPVPATPPDTGIINDLIDAGALRQLRHNDGTPQFVFAYDRDVTDQFIGHIVSQRVRAAIAELAAAPQSRVPQDAKDAERYRAMRNLPPDIILQLIDTSYDFVPFVMQHTGGASGSFAVLTGDDADAAIDAAITAQSNDAGKGGMK